MRVLNVLCGTTAIALASPAFVERSASQPCEIASTAYVNSVYFGDPRIIIPASIAADCIKSVPLNKQLDSDLIDYLIPYVEFQSTLGYLKNPPQGYLAPAVDLVHSLQSLKQNLAANEYSMQWQFMQDLQNIFISAADSHLTYTPALFNVFKFVRSDSLVSLSEDGVRMPQVYVAREVDIAYKSNSKAEPISHIDGDEVTHYLETLSGSMRYQDPDAQYQSLFYSKSLDARFYSQQSDVTAFGAGFNYLMGSYVALPEELEITYASGRKHTISNMAVVLQDVGVSSGEEFQETFEIPQSSQTSSTSATTTTQTPTATKPVGPAYRTANPGYPQPVASVPGAWLAGYFLEGQYSDTAVLDVVSFGSLNSGDNANTVTVMLSVRQTLADFLDNCKKQGKTKLVIDLSANPGGDVLLPYQIYSQLFPHASYPWDGFRYQASDAMNFIGEHIYNTTEAAAFFPAELNRQLQRYPDWQALFGPEKLAQAEETNLVRMNLSGSFGVRYHHDSTQFQPKNVVVVSDGACSGACTLLIRLLTYEQNVRTIAFGGRPMQGPMEVMGGSKGAEAVDFSLLASAAASAEGGSPVPTQVTLPNPGTPPLNPPLESLGTFNLRNVYPENNSKRPPFQFVYEPANCRRFFTANEYLNISAYWSAAADVAWNGAKCVPGSTVNSDGTIGDRPPTGRKRQ